MPDPIRELLAEAGRQFRFYEKQHRAKPRSEDTLAKAEVNRALAARIEAVLAAPAEAGDDVDAAELKTVASALCHAAGGEPLGLIENAASRPGEDARVEAWAPWEDDARALLQKLARLRAAPGVPEGWSDAYAAFVGPLIRR